MNHNITLGIVGIVAAMALTAVAFTIPQQALAYKHHHNHNSVKVDQQINQINNCTTALCDNQADNTFGPPPVSIVWH
jgi:hypothetical protein